MGSLTTVSRVLPARLAALLVAVALVGFWEVPLLPADEVPGNLVEQVIDFGTDCAGHPHVAGQVLTEVCGAGGAGPILVSGRLGAAGTSNVAVLFDSSDPTGSPIDDDLGSPNEECPGGGPGEGAGGEPGATWEGLPTENCPDDPLGLVLIVAENLNGAAGDGIVDNPDDADVVGSLLRFDFSALGAVTVTAIKLMDVEADEQRAEVRFYADPQRQILLSLIQLPRTGDNGLAMIDLGKNTDVVVMEVKLNGSGAIDDLVFAYSPCPPSCDDDDACTEDFCDPETGECEHELVECDDGDACTLDECDAQTGACLHAVIDCDDSDPCHPFVCVDGACVAMPVECDDGDPCTFDECVGGECVFIPDPECALSCRVTGGANGQQAGSGNRYHGSGQAGAPGSSFGEWTHHQKNGPDGKFVFHAGTASAPAETHIQIVSCSDPGFCEPARPAPAKQIDFAGVGTFKNIHNPPPALEDLEPGETLHWFEVHIEDLGEPGDRGGGDDELDESVCPPDGSAGSTASCECSDFYRVVIYAAFEPGEPPNTTDVIYRVSEYIRDGNYQVHPGLE